MTAIPHVALAIELRDIAFDSGFGLAFLFAYLKGAFMTLDDAELCLRFSLYPSILIRLNIPLRSFEFIVLTMITHSILRLFPSPQDFFITTCVLHWLFTLSSGAGTCYARDVHVVGGFLGHVIAQLSVSTV